MISYYLKDDISKDSFEKMVTFFNDHNVEKLYIDSPGGSWHVMEMMAEFLNEWKGVAVGQKVNSAAFLLFYSLNDCKRILLPSSQGMIHQSIHEIQLNEHRKPAYHSDAIMFKDGVKRCATRIKEILESIGFEDWSKFKKQQDIHYHTPELQAFLDTQNGRH